MLTLLNHSETSLLQCTTKQSNQLMVLHNINKSIPPHPLVFSYLDNLTHDKHKIPFNIIGADTTLFDKSVDDVQVVSLGPAERVDILINFESSMP